jgi:hypothetical protein
MPNPFGGYQVGTLPGQRGAPNGVTGQTGGPVGPVTPSDSLLVANDVEPSLVPVGGTAVQLDAAKVANRISISIQNQGTVTVEIYPNSNKPAFGSGGWQIAAGGWFDFNYTEDIKVYAVTGGTTVNLAVFQNVKR